MDEMFLRNSNLLRCYVQYCICCCRDSSREQIYQCSKKMGISLPNGGEREEIVLWCCVVVYDATGVFFDVFQ